MISPNKRVQVVSVLAIALCATAGAQRRDEENGSDRDETTKQHYGYPQDWSSRHRVMAGDDGKDPLRAGSREPRHVYNRVMREVAR